MTAEGSRIETAADAPARSSEPTRDEALRDEALQTEPLLGGGLIEKRTGGWVITVGETTRTLPENASAEHVVREVTALLDADASSDRRCVLALPADECFFVTLPPDGMVNANEPTDTIDAKDATAVAYELERVLPVDAESMVVDAWSYETTKQLIAVATVTDRHRDLTEAIESAEIELVAIVPSAVLVARVIQQWRSMSGPFGLGIFDGESCDHLILDAEGVVHWKHCGDFNEWIRHQAVIANQAAKAETLVVIGRETIPAKIDGPVQWCPLSFRQALNRGAALVLQGRWGRWTNLRRGGLAPKDPLVAVARPLRWFSLAAIACCLLVIASAWYRGERIAQRSRDVLDRQRAVYRDAFPDRRVPVMLMRSVRGEYERTLGSRGRGQAIDLPQPATAVLADLYEGLQRAQTDGVRFRLLEIKIEDGTCSLTLRAPDAVQIGSIAKSLERSGFRVQPPAAQQLDPSRDEPIPTFQSTIAAEWLGNTEPPADIATDVSEPAMRTPETP